MNDKAGVDPPKKFFFLYLTSPHLESELLYIFDCFFYFLCSALIPWFCPYLVFNMKTAALTSTALSAGLWPCLKKLLCVHCVKQLAKFPYRICCICFGQISYLHCKKGYKKCQPVGVDVPMSES